MDNAKHIQSLGYCLFYNIIMMTAMTVDMNHHRHRYNDIIIILLLYIILCCI